MCLLISHPASTEFDFDDIADFHLNNSDGLGVMWSDGNTLFVQKSLPKTAVEAFDFYNKYCLGKECVIHFRLKTHGTIRVDQSHPFEIFGDGSSMPVYLAHNGILHTGNKEDPTLSDTELYIRNYLVPLTQHNPELLFHPAFMDLVEEHIGSGNKFIIMDHSGRTAIFNEKQFVDYKGAKLSNTYAWNASKGGYGFKYGSKSKGQGAWWTQDDYEYDWTNYRNYNPTKPGTTDAPAQEADPVGGSSDEDFDTALEFFNLLEDFGYHEAYNKISYADLVRCIDDCGEELWEEFETWVVSGTLKDVDIIESVKDVDYMLDMMYGQQNQAKLAAGMQ